MERARKSAGVRASFEARLDADWPGYVAKALTNARPAA